MKAFKYFDFPIIAKQFIIEMHSQMNQVDVALNFIKKNFFLCATKLIELNIIK